MVYLGAEYIYAPTSVWISKAKSSAVGTQRQLRQSTLRRKDEDLIREQVHFEIIQEIQGIGLGIAQHLPYFHDPLVKTIVIDFDSLVFPVCRESFFRDLIHSLGADLNLRAHCPFGPITVVCSDS